LQSYHALHIRKHVRCNHGVHEDELCAIIDHRYHLVAEGSEDDGILQVVTL
jgi:hypothetical protein